MKLEQGELQTLRDAAGLIVCNCSYSADTEPENRCDGSCTHSELLAMAKKYGQACSRFDGGPGDFYCVRCGEPEQMHPQH